MDREYQSGAVAAPPERPAVSTGYPTNGDPAALIPPTVPGAWRDHMIMEELMAVIAQGGLQPDGTTLTQVRDAVTAIADARAAAAVGGIVIPEPDLAAYATRNWVRARLLELVDGAPADLDTLNKLAVAIGLCLTQAQVDARIEAKAPKDVVLASGIDLAAGVRSAHALSGPLDGYRWLAVVAGESSAEYGTYLRVPRAAVTPLQGAANVELLAAAERGSGTFQLYAVDPMNGSLTARGAGANIPGLDNVGMTWHGDSLLAAAKRDRGTFQLYAVDPANGSLTSRGSKQVLGTAIEGVGLVSHLGELLAAVGRAAKLQLYAVDPTNGSLTARGAETSIAGLNDGVGLASTIGTGGRGRAVCASIVAGPATWA